MQNANCAERGVWATGNGGGNRTLLIRHVSALAALSFASSKVSKFISNNYVAINKPMPAIKGGARATGLVGLWGASFTRVIAVRAAHYSCSRSAKKETETATGQVSYSYRF